MILVPRKIREQRDLIIAYKRVFGTPEGKSVLYDLINRFHVLNDLPSKDQKEFSVGKAEGQRSVALHVLRQCRINLEQLDAMLKGEETNDFVG